MNYIYKISVEEVDYDGFISFVVIAKNEKDIIPLLRKYDGCYGEMPFYSKEHFIERIGITTLKPQIIEGSFNAG